MKNNISDEKIHPVKFSRAGISSRTKLFSRVKELLSRGVEEIIDKKILKNNLFLVKN